MSKKAIYLETAPAKINSFLEIKKLREDGFHDIETVFQAIELCDHLNVEILVEQEPSEDLEFELKIDSNEAKVAELKEKNIVAKAIEAYFSYLGENEKLETQELINSISKIEISVFIDKKIPLEAGLAGGSSNAAAMLRILNRFFSENLGFGLDSKELTGIAARLGSDVPFCLESKVSPQVLAKGRGEIFQDPKSKDNLLSKYLEAKTIEEFLNELKEYSNLVIVKPNFGISTAAAYTNFDLLEGRKKPDDGLLNKVDLSSNPFFNRFEEVIKDDHPEIGSIKNKLIDAGCDYALMSGSGSSVVGFTKEKDKLENILEKLSTDLPKDYLLIKSFACFKGK